MTVAPRGADPADRTDPDDLAALLEVAVAAAAAAADLLVEGLHRPRIEIETKSTGTDMVTEMDRAAERLVVERLLAHRPDDGIIGEEGTDRPGTSGLRWIVDPLDGTTNYLYGHAGFAVSIAVADGEEVLAGVVHDPLHGEVFTATRGGGAHRNGTAISVSSEVRLDHALVATGFSYDPERRRRQAAVLVELLPLVRDIRRMGAAAVDLCSVACGRVDAYYEKGLQVWDHAAGGLIAREAGAEVQRLGGGPIGDGVCVAAPPALLGPLTDLLARHGAADA